MRPNLERAWFWMSLYAILVGVAVVVAASYQVHDHRWQPIVQRVGFLRPGMVHLRVRAVAHEYWLELLLKEYRTSPTANRVWTHLRDGSESDDAVYRTLDNAISWDVRLRGKTLNLQASNIIIGKSFTTDAECRLYSLTAVPNSQYDIFVHLHPNRYLASLSPRLEIVADEGEDLQRRILAGLWVLAGSVAAAPGVSILLIIGYLRLEDMQA